VTELWLVRHGQTDWNLAGRYQGQSDVPLNETGRQQAFSAAAQLAGGAFDALFSSDLCRALETATVIGAAIGLPVIQDARLREIDQGDWEGLLVEEIRLRYAAEWALRQGDAGSVRPPGGESVEEVAARVYSALDEIALRYPDGRIVVVCHGLAIATVVCHVRGLPVSRAYDVIPPNALPERVTWR
jgi:broad specificity phosphatase PhoE